ncbi:MAG: hypothetical protein ACJ74F_03920, partial [Mycobacterium sp.]
MPERVAEAIEEIARPNRDEKQEKPQIQGDPALRRPRLIRNTPAATVAVIVLACAAAAGWAVSWALGLDAVSRHAALTFAGRLPVRVLAAVVTAVVVGALVAWAFGPTQTLRRGSRTWLTAARRRSPRVPLIGSLTAAVVIGVGLAAMATRIISGAVVERAVPASDVGVVKTALPAIVGAVIAVAMVVVYRRQKDSERSEFAQRFGSASTQL